MGLVIVVSAPPPPLPRLVRAVALSTLRGGAPPQPLHRRRRLRLRGLVSLRRPKLRRPSQNDPCGRWDNLTSKCSMTNLEVDFNHVETKDEAVDELSSLSSGCSIPVVHLTADVLNSGSLNLLTEETCQSSIFSELPVLSEGEQDTLSATPVHPAGLHALYASYLFGNLVEQLWNFAWPAALAILHPSLLPVAVVGFFTKLSIFIGAPIVGRLMDHFPRLPTYQSLNAIQLGQLKDYVVWHWGSLWSVIGLYCLSCFFEKLAGADRPVALAQANAVLNRVDLLCEIAGASVFGFLLSKFDPVTCLKMAGGLMIFTLPFLLILGQIINNLSSHALDRYRVPCDKSAAADMLLDAGKIVENGLEIIKHGWKEYKHQPVLPASVASVLLYFNVALAPGAIMTALLMHHGISPSIIGCFSGLCSLMGFAATFISSSLVKRLGILKAGAAGLIFQALLLTVAVAAYWTGSISQKIPLMIFLTSIVLSRLGHMSYDVVGTQILQMGIPISKANLIGTTEVSIASLAEFLMLGVAIIANDVSHFGFLALLSVSSVAGASWMFCRWLANPTDEQRKLFVFDWQFEAIE